MKNKLFKLLVLTLVSSCLFACTSSGGGGSYPSISGSEVVGEKVEGIPDRLIIRFKNEEASYDGLAFWIWSDSVKNEKDTTPLGVDGDGFLYCEVNPNDYIRRGETSLWFLVKSAGDDVWTYQTADTEIVYANFDVYMVNNVKTMNVYAQTILNVNKTRLELSDSLDSSDRDYIKTATISNNGRSIEVVGTGEISSYRLYGLNNLYYINYDPLDPSFNMLPYILKIDSGINSDTVSIPLDEINFNTVYQVEAVFSSDLNRSATKLVDTSAYFNKTAINTVVYDGDDLGVTFDEDGVPIFKVYAPTAALVQVNIYKHGYPSGYSKYAIPPSKKAEYDNSLYTINLVPDSETGVFSSENSIGGDWMVNSGNREDVASHEYYYTYTVYNANGAMEVLDPYARTTSVNSLRALIPHMDSPKATPEAWDALPTKWDGDPRLDISSPQELIISENHIRDLTMDETWSSVESDREIAGTYEAFAKEGTTYTQNGTTVKTGFDHMEEYGVNAVQLLPIFDQDNDDLEIEFNWGYNPLNYNVPEGSYSSDPYDPYARVYELRELIAKYANNDNNTRIIMDVVYNHVSRASNSNFEYLVPGYYFRLDENGFFLDGSGCGNEFNSQAPMARKFIVDSVCYWATEYKIKGFRFDLMGLIDVQTMREVKEALYAIDPDIVVYGEGWDATGAYANNPDYANTSSAYSSLYSSLESPGYVGAFNDAARNGLRGDNNSGGGYPGWGFISQGVGDLSRDKVKAVDSMMIGAHEGKGGNPVQTINYASCHDNYTLYDQLLWTLSNDGGKTKPQESVVAQASVAVNGLVILSNGISFINGGEEIFRSKVETDEESKYAVNMYGQMISHNSYKSSDETNSYKWNRKVELLEYFNMYKQLVELKKKLANAPFDEGIDSGIVSTWGTATGTTLASYHIGIDGTNYYIFFNGRSDSSVIDFGDENATQLMSNGPTFTKTSSGLTISGAYGISIWSSAKGE